MPGEWHLPSPPIIVLCLLISNKNCLFCLLVSNKRRCQGTAISVRRLGTDLPSRLFLTHKVMIQKQDTRLSLMSSDYHYLRSHNHLHWYASIICMRLKMAKDIRNKTLV